MPYSRVNHSCFTFPSWLVHLRLHLPSPIKCFTHVSPLYMTYFCHMLFLFVIVPLFDLCLTSRYFITSVFHLLTFYFILWSSKFTLSSIFHSLFIHPFTICLLHILYSVSMLLCSISIIIFPPSVHYSLPSFPNLDNSTFHSLWLCKSSFTFSISLWAL